MKRTARHKLNAATLNGILIMSTIVALLFRSWLVFVLVAAAMLLTALCAGDIRLDSDQADRR